MKNSSWDVGFGKVATRSAQSLLILALIAVTFLGLTKLSLVVIPFIIAIILASAMYPFVALLGKFKINRTSATIMTLVSFLLMIGGAGYFIVTSVQTQWSSLSSSVKKAFEQARAWINSGDLPISGKQVDEITNITHDYLTSSVFGQGVLQFSANIFSLLAGTVLTLVILFFFLKDGDKVFAFIVRFLKVEARDKANEAGIRAVNVLGDYIRGTTIIALVDAILIGIGLTIMGVPLVLPLCLLVFIGAYIPYIGAVSAGVLASLVALMSNGTDAAIIVIIIVLAVNQIEGYLLAPFILGTALKMSSLAILLVLTVGAIVGGIVGTLLAVPLTAVLWVVWTTWNESHLQPITEKEKVSVSEGSDTSKEEPVSE